MVTGCQATPGCIAYIGISYLGKTQADGLGEAMLENASGKFELPTPATMSQKPSSWRAKTPANETLSMIYDKAANGYPIVNYEYAIIPPKEAQRQGGTGRTGLPGLGHRPQERERQQLLDPGRLPAPYPGRRRPV